MTFKSLLLSAALVLASAATGSAATYNLGDVTGGTTVSKVLTVKTLDFLNFSITAPTGFKLSGLVISATSTTGSNFSEAIGLYKGSTLFATAEAARGGGRSGGKTATLSLADSPQLVPGAYTLGVGAWKAFFTPDIADARSTASFNNGTYSVSITPTITAVPLPAGGLLILTALGAIALAGRKKRNTTA
jgi:hypothetical protein